MKKFMTWIALSLSFLLSPAYGSNLSGTLFISPENQAGLAVEKNKNGEMLLIVETNDNPYRTPFALGFSDPSMAVAIFENEAGEARLVLQVYVSKAVAASVNRPIVTLLDVETGRTRQILSLSRKIQNLYESHYLEDEVGNNRDPREIREIAIQFHTREPGAFDVGTKSAVFRVENLAVAQLAQLAGAEISSTPLVKEDPLVSKLNSLDDIRIQEWSTEIVENNLRNVLREFDYADAEIEMIISELLNFRNANKTSAEIILAHENRKSMFIQMGLNERAERVAETIIAQASAGANNCGKSYFNM